MQLHPDIVRQILATPGVVVREAQSAACNPVTVRDTISEDDFLELVLDLAKVNGWKRAHFRPAKTAKGWRTAVSGDGKGFVDLVLARERIVWAELKSEKGDVKPAQADWIEALEAAGQEVYVWRPSDWDTVQRVLTTAILKDAV